MSISSLGATASQLPLSLLSQLNSAASDVFSGDDGAEESAAPSNALTGSTTASLSKQMLQTLLGLQQDSSSPNAQSSAQAASKPHRHGHGGHGHGGGGTADTLENILDAADNNTTTASNSGTSSVTDPLDLDNSQVTL